MITVIISEDINNIKKETDLDESDKKIKKLILNKSVKDIVRIFTKEKIFQNQKFITIVLVSKMKSKFIKSLIILMFLSSCIGTSSTGIFGTGGKYNGS